MPSDHDRAYHREYMVTRREDFKGRLDDIKWGAVCADCGVEWAPWQMHYHHRDPAEKRDTVCAMVNRGHSWESVLAEIAKCDLICANCHASRHHRRLPRMRYAAV